MKAFVSKMNENGDSCVGTEFATVSPEYKTFKGLRKYAANLVKLWKSPVIIELYKNWDNRYDSNKAQVLYMDSDCCVHI